MPHLTSYFLINMEPNNTMGIWRRIVQSLMRGVGSTMQDIFECVLTLDKRSV